MSEEQRQQTYADRHRDLLVRALARAIPKGSPVALLDFPDHGNVGDSAIWLGEIHGLRANRNTISYTSSIHRHEFSARTLRAVMPEGVVLLHGGGNLGDLWPKHNNLRRKVLTDLVDYKVVLLPQTLHVTSDAAWDDLRAILLSHPALTTLCRDRTTERELEKIGVQTALCPDAAFGIPSLDPAPPTRRLGWLLRTDHESPLLDAPLLGKRDDVFDWRSLGLGDNRPRPIKSISTRSRRLRRRALEAWPERVATSLMRSRAARMTRAADRRVQAGVTAIGTYDLLITNRLHGLLLRVLMDRPVIVIDSGYGKIDRYIEAFPPRGNAGTIHIATSVDEAQEIAASLMRR